MTTTRMPPRDQSRRRLTVARKLDQPPYGLTPRELDVLALLADGLYDREVANVLGIPEATVKDYAISILQKMNARSRTEAAVKAIREHIFTAGENSLGVVAHD